MRKMCWTCKLRNHHRHPAQAQTTSPLGVFVRSAKLYQRRTRTSAAIERIVWLVAGCSVYSAWLPKWWSLGWETDDILCSPPVRNNDEYRCAAYYQFILWRYGKLRAGERISLPSCCVLAIWNKFPSPDGQYKGFVRTRSCKDSSIKIFSIYFCVFPWLKLLGHVLAWAYMRTVMFLTLTAEENDCVDRLRPIVEGNRCAIIWFMIKFIFELHRRFQTYMHATDSGCAMCAKVVRRACIQFHILFPVRFRTEKATLMYHTIRIRAAVKVLKDRFSLLEKPAISDTTSAFSNKVDKRCKSPFDKPEGT